MVYVYVLSFHCKNEIVKVTSYLVVGPVVNVTTKVFLKAAFRTL